MTTEQRVDASLERASQEYLKLFELVVETDHGEMLTYSEVQATTGVDMSMRKNRDKLRRVIRRARKEYEIIPKIGYRLAAPDSAMRILTHKLSRIDGAVKKAERSQAIIQREFIESLSEEERKDVFYLGSIFGSIRLAAENGRKVYGKAPRPQVLPPYVPNAP